MAVWFCVLSAALGATIAWAITYTLMKAAPRNEAHMADIEGEEAMRFARQMDNFMNYSGSERGQVDIED